jgi:hypothetical protein
LTPAGLLAQFAEDLTQPVMHSFEDSRMVVERGGRQARQRRDRVIDPRVSWFAIHKICLSSGYSYCPRERYRPPRNEARMTVTAEQCREALQKLAGRLSELSSAERADYFGNRTMSCTIPDLGVTFRTQLGTEGDPDVREQTPDDPPADIRITASSEDVLSLAESPMNIARMWLSGKVKIEASMKDLFRLRRLL